VEKVNSQQRQGESNQGQINDSSFLLSDHEVNDIAAR
jgi:hypothetical protein